MHDCIDYDIVQKPSYNTEYQIQLFIFYCNYLFCIKTRAFIIFYISKLIGCKCC